MAGQIRITPEELREGQTYLAAQKQEAMYALTNIKNKIEEVTSNWEGAAQNSFVATFDDLYKQISEALPKTVEGVENMLTGAADAMEKADTEIGKAFKG